MIGFFITCLIILMAIMFVSTVYCCYGVRPVCVFYANGSLEFGQQSWIYHNPKKNPTKNPLIQIETLRYQTVNFHSTYICMNECSSFSKIV